MQTHPLKGSMLNAALIIKGFAVFTYLHKILPPKRAESAMLRTVFLLLLLPLSLSQTFVFVSKNLWKKNCKHLSLGIRIITISTHDDASSLNSIYVLLIS